MKRIGAVVCAGLLCTIGNVPAYAVGSGGFTTQFPGAKAMGQGNAFVGQADDPSAITFNPAGITQLSSPEIMGGTTLVTPMATRSGNGSADDHLKKQLFSVPHAYATMPLDIKGHKTAFGFGLTSPFGLATDWAPTSTMRYTTTLSQFQMANLNPTMALQISPALSIGAGANYADLFNLEAKNQINQALANSDQSGDATAHLKGNGSGWGYNVGALYKPVERHSFGASYRSQIKIPVNSTFDLSHLSAATQANYHFASDRYATAARTDVTLPASILLGYAFKASDAWTLLSDYELTEWNSIESQDLSFRETDPQRLAFLTGNSATNVARHPRRWHNASSVGAGANYKQNDAWQWRGGYAFLQKTVPNDTYDPDVPNANIHLLTAGLSHAWGAWLLDLAFNAYIYENRDVNNTVGNEVGGTVNGTYQTFIPALAASLTYKFGSGSR